MYCQNCGCTNEDNALICDNCGAELENSKPPVDDSKKKIKIIVMILSIVVTVLAAVVVGIVIHNESDNKNLNENMIISRKTTNSSTQSYKESSVAETVSENTEETTKSTTAQTDEQNSLKDTKKGTVTTKGTTERKNQDNNNSVVTEKTTEKGTKKSMHKEYRYREKSYTTSTHSSMDGWTCYDSNTEWSDYGSWSNWSTSTCSKSSSRQVESRTTYRFCVFRCTKCGNRDPYSTPCDNCKTSQYFKWEEMWYPTKGNSMSKHTMSTVPDKYYVTIDGKRWWFEKDGYSDGQGGTGQPSRQEYRYRDRKQITTYYFYRWGNWSDWSTTPVSSSNNREVETREVY